LRVSLLLSGVELGAHIILLADENQLPGGYVVFVFEKIMDPQPKILQIELAEIFAGDREWIEIILLQVSPKLAALFLIFAPKKPRYEKEQRNEDRRDNINAELALQSFSHRTNLFPTA